MNNLETLSGVTVVVPCYNDGVFIRKAIDSILHQTLLPDKIIIVDDGSQTETQDLLGRWNNPLIEVIYQKNKGVSAARNKGISMSKTPWILTLDADDYFDDSFIEKARLILQSNPEVGVVCSYYQKFDESGIYDKIIKPQGSQARDFLIKNNGVASAMFRKQCWEDVGGYDANFKKGYEDWDFWLSILKKDWIMRVIEEPLFFYRQKKNSRDKIAFHLHDLELRQLLYNKHKRIYVDKIDYFASQLLRENTMLRTTLKKRESSKEYRLGSLLLSPLKAIKNLVKSVV